MKKVILIYFIVILNILFVGCKPASIIDDQTKKAEESKSNNVANYKVSINEYTAYNEEDKAFKVKYAQISDLGNEKLENQINKTLKLSITEWINKDCEWAKRFQIAVKCKTPNYLSVCYTIEWKNSQGEDFMSNYTRFGVTVDMNTGERIFLDELIKDTAMLKQKLENYNYGNELSPPIDSEEADKILNFASISEKKYYDEEYKNGYSLYNFLWGKPSFYLTDKQVVITRDENEFDDVYMDFKQ